MGSKGYYKLTVLDAAGNIKTDKSTGIIANVVTYGGAFEALIGIGIFQAYECGIGTGTVERVRSSTDLGNLDAGKSNSVSASRTGNEVDNGDGTSTVTVTRTFEFVLGDKVGTFSEVGVYDGSVFIAGQLIKDSGGSPTTITLLADEQLIVTYIIEWTVPIVSTQVGSGTVTDAASNTYNYQIWSQPYFATYGSLGDSTVTRRYANPPRPADEVGFFAANGTTSLADSGDVGGGYGNRYSHNGSGVVTVTSEPFTFSPTSITFTNLVFMCMYCFDSNDSASNIVDTATALNRSSTLSFTTFVVKFLDPITKTSSDSFALEISATINL